MKIAALLLVAVLALACGGPDDPAPPPHRPPLVIVPTGPGCDTACVALHKYETGSWCDCVNPESPDLGVLVCVCHDADQGAADVCPGVCAALP